MTVGEECRTWRSFLGSYDAPVVAYLELAVQVFQNFHRRPGITGSFRRWQQLECAQPEPHRIVPGHLPAMLETQNLLQAQLLVQSGSIPVGGRIVR